jgi:hypothetical protein
MSLKHMQRLRSSDFPKAGDRAHADARQIDGLADFLQAPTPVYFKLNGVAGGAT